ncbi:hypothetical protein J6590_094055 [Homalodisca vitripennis]|nr:hypothetical protein J6590_094055 [Homalodisca vitripennis]
MTRPGGHDTVAGVTRHDMPRHAAPPAATQTTSSELGLRNVNNQVYVEQTDTSSTLLCKDGDDSNNLRVTMTMSALIVPIDRQGCRQHPSRSRPRTSVNCSTLPWPAAATVICHFI